VGKARPAINRLIVKPMPQSNEMPPQLPHGCPVWSMRNSETFGQNDASQNADLLAQQKTKPDAERQGE
jgi:hypothetical protein